MLTRTEGIVLKTQKYGEADLITTHLTSDLGIIKTFAKSPRKTKSRFGSSLEPLTHSRLSLWGKEQSSMPKITQSDILNSFHRIRENYHDFIQVSKLAEILLSLMPEAIPNKRIFSFFLNILQYIQSLGNEPKEALHLIAQVRLLAAIGYAPRLGGCGRCGNNSLDFYPDAGTTLCKRCASGSSGERSKPFLRVSDRAARFYFHSIEWPISISNRLKPDRGSLLELSSVLDRHLDYLLSKKLMTSGFRDGGLRSPGSPTI